MPKDLRNIERENFLVQNHIDYVDILPLKVDASSRKYFRICLKDGATFVLADDELKTNRLPEFDELSAFFIARGIHAPKVHAKDFDKGFLLLEDLGDATLTKLLAQGEDEEFLYTLATDALIDIAKITTHPACTKDLTTERLLNDICFFADWYIPMSKGRGLTTAERAEFVRLVTPLADLAFKVPNRFVLWDYHVDNVMLPQNADACAIIDFQDALWGPVTYDIMSLLEDARREVRADIQQKMKQKFFASLDGVNKEDFEDSFAFLSLFRHMRVLGRFTILAFINQKPQYLQFVPHLWNMLSKILAYPKFAALKKWLDNVLPEKNRIIPTRKPITEAMVLAAGRGIRMR
ncbi:MAG: phosphotransferase, partial [Alphaproteobacteria bacterium]|nr:phosphotransferase [Alphaproteobacteria bacterium]